MNFFSEKAAKEVLADHIIQYAKKHGMWPTIDFIVQRWIEKNPEEFATIKSGISDDQKNLQDDFGSNEKSRKGGVRMRRVLEIPEKIVILINTLFLVEKSEYLGGDKAFWREFARRYPVFRVGRR